MKPHVIIIGGGFGGLKAAKLLGKSGRVKVTVLDRKNHHLFQPLLYQVATASLNPSDIAMPIRQILGAQTDTNVLMENVLSVDLAGKTVITESDRHPYDYLVMACGSSHSYFGHTDWEPLAPGLKTIEQALEIRRRVLTALELSEKEKDPKVQTRLLTFIVIGGGPTGVELAGALAELAHSIVSTEFDNIESARIRVVLVQGDARLLLAFSPALSEKAKLALEKKGVEVLMGRHATEITALGVRLGDEFIESATVLWAAGVKPSPLNGMLGVPLDRQGRVLVAEDLSVPGHPEAFVIGDQAHFETPKGPLPGLAPVAMQQGLAVGTNILRDLDKKSRKPFRYLDKGIMAVIGRSFAVTEFHGLELSGFPAWAMWLFVHIMYLVGHRNRIIVLINWAWSYLTFQRGARLITLASWRDADLGQAGRVTVAAATPAEVSAVLPGAAVPAAGKVPG